MSSRGLLLITSGNFATFDANLLPIIETMVKTMHLMFDANSIASLKGAKMALDLTKPVQIKIAKNTWVYANNVLLLTSHHKKTFLATWFLENGRETYSSFTESEVRNKPRKWRYFCWPSDTRNRWKTNGEINFFFDEVQKSWIKYYDPWTASCFIERGWTETNAKGVPLTQKK